MGVFRNLIEAIRDLTAEIRLHRESLDRSTTAMSANTDLLATNLAALQATAAQVVTALGSSDDALIGQTAATIASVNDQLQNALTGTPTSPTPAPALAPAAS